MIPIRTAPVNIKTTQPTEKLPKDARLNKKNLLFFNSSRN
jgi:hypothetical protein